MDERVYRYRVWALFLAVAAVVVVWLPEIGGADFRQPPGSTTESELSIHFLDVGQGDAIFIESPEGVQMLIDGGRDASVVRELGTAMSFWDKTIDVVVATHPDSDHIGGLIDVLERYEVGVVVTSGNEGETSTAAAFRAAVAAEDAAAHTALANDVISLGASTTFYVLSPGGNASDLESNTASVVGQLRFGDTDVMLTGDAPASIEKYLVGAYGAALQSDILKVGHHGSRTSTAAEFLTVVAPTYAIISAGRDNTYGHPHREVTDTLHAANLTVLETATAGTITFVSDGTTWRKE